MIRTLFLFVAVGLVALNARVLSVEAWQPHRYPGFLNFSEEIASLCYSELTDVRANS